MGLEEIVALLTKLPHADVALNILQRHFKIIILEMLQGWYGAFLL